jgi:cell division protein FtsL
MPMEGANALNAMQTPSRFTHLLSMLLVILVATSAMAVVNTQHSARKLYAASERAVGQLRQLDAELEVLVVQQRKLASPQRIEQVARTRLAMQPVTAARTLNVLYAASPEKARGSH